MDENKERKAKPAGNRQRQKYRSRRKAGSRNPMDGGSPKAPARRRRGKAKRKKIKKQSRPILRLHGAAMQKG